MRPEGSLWEADHGREKSQNEREEVGGKEREKILTLGSGYGGAGFGADGRRLCGNAGDDCGAVLGCAFAAGTLLDEPAG